MTDPLDPAAIVTGFGGNRPLARQAAAAFVQESPRLVARIDQALAASDAPALAAAAHALKSAVGNFPAPLAVEAAQRLEDRGRRNELGGADADRAALGQALAPLTAALAVLARQ